MTQLDVEIKYPIISQGDALIPSLFCFKNIDKGHVHTNLLYRHKVWICNDPDLLEGLECKPPIYPPPPNLPAARGNIAFLLGLSTTPWKAARWLMVTTSK